MIGAFLAQDFKRCTFLKARRAARVVQLAQRRHDTERTARIAKTTSEPIDKDNRFVRLAQKRGAGVRPNKPGVGIRDNRTTAGASNIRLSRATLCQRRGTPSDNGHSVLQKEVLATTGPIRPLCAPYAGRTQAPPPNSPDVAITGPARNCRTCLALGSLRILRAMSVEIIGRAGAESVTGVRELFGQCK
jgi:hypothetical protein